MKNIILTTAMLIIANFVIFSLRGQTVEVEGRKIIVNNQTYRINGICYNRGGAGNYTEDIKLMKEANINTIRTYSPIDDIKELDAFADADIRIIMHLDENDFETYVNKYKNHRAILMWEFGNEFNYHPEWFGGDMNTWYNKLEACAARVQELDENHPVTSAHGEVPTIAVINSCPSVDVWGMNLYRWDNNVPALTQLASNTSKAMYVSEAGSDSYNKKDEEVNEEEQAQANENIITGIIEKFDICAGVCIFEFCDEWWKAGNDTEQNTGGSAPNSSGVPYDGSADEEYWGIVHRDRSKKTTFETIKNIYASVIVKISIKKTDTNNSVNINFNNLTKYITADFSQNNKQIELLQITDTTGKIIYNKKIRLNSDRLLQIKPEISFNTGIYFISIIGHNFNKTKEIVIIKQ